MSLKGCPTADKINYIVCIVLADGKHESQSRACHRMSEPRKRSTVGSRNDCRRGLTALHNRWCKQRAISIFPRSVLRKPHSLRCSTNKKGKKDAGGGKGNGKGRRAREGAEK